jgi:hypothetical protein
LSVVLTSSPTIAGWLKDAKAGPEDGVKAMEMSAAPATTANIAIGCSAERRRSARRGHMRLRSRGVKARSNSVVVIEAVIVVGLSCLSFGSLMKERLTPLCF